MKFMSDEFKETTTLTAARDGRDPDPHKDYGIHGVELRMVLQGPEGAVQFLLYTNWQLPHVQREMDEKAIERIRDRDDDGKMQLRCFYHPLPADLGYHSPKPMYEGQSAMGSEKFDWERTETLKGEAGSIKIPTTIATGTFDPCEYVGGGPCYYDGSTLNAEPIYEVLLREGSAGVWRELRAYYDATFRSEKS